MRAHTFRPLVLLLSGCFFAAMASTGCVDPYASRAESLKLPKKKTPKPRPEGTEAVAYGGLNEPDTCKTDFTSKPQSVPKTSAVNRANSISQDADNAMAGINDATGAARRNMALEAINILRDALRVNPYSPLATYTMAKAYAAVGKKKCSLAMLDRLNSIGGMPDFAEAVGKLKSRAKTDPTFEPFRKEADGVLGGQ